MQWKISSAYVSSTFVSKCKAQKTYHGMTVALVGQDLTLPYNEMEADSQAQTQSWQTEKRTKCMTVCFETWVSQAIQTSMQ